MEKVQAVVQEKYGQFKVTGKTATLFSDTTDDIRPNFLDGWEAVQKFGTPEYLAL